MNNTSLIRYPVILMLATLLTAALFLELFKLTAASFEFVPLAKPVPIDFKRLVTDSIDTPVVIERQKPVREVPVNLPDGPGVRTEDDDNGRKDKLTKVQLPGRIGIDIVKPIGPIAGSDHETIPIVRISPQYPSSAETRGLEGWVQVRYNITTAGAVSDVRVVDSNPRGVFDKAAVDAIVRWRYNPKIEEGQAVETRGVETVLRFELK